MSCAKRVLLSVATVAGLGAVGLPASSQGGWTGHWAGRTNTGQDVSITINGGRVVSYEVSGSQINVVISRMSSREITLQTDGTRADFLIRRGSGGAAVWSVQDATFGHASALLYRR